MRYLFRLSQSLFAVGLLALAAPAHAAPEGCGTSSIDYVDEAGLTREERIRRMDAALMRSLNQYDECQDDEAPDRENAQQDPDPAQQNTEGGGTASAAAEGADPSEGAEGEGAESEGAEGEAAAEGAQAEGTQAEGTQAEGTQAEGQSEGESGGTASAAAGDMSGTDPGPGPDPSGAMPLPGVVPSLPSTQTGAQGAGGSGGASGQQNGTSQEAGIGGAAGSENLPAGSSSAASGDMTGTEPVAPPRRVGVAGAGVEDESQQAGSAGSRENTGVARTGPRALPNGKLPEDIPTADNDSVLEAQIREAAINETDPELKKKLWNEYRRYKGLPQVK